MKTISVMKTIFAKSYVLLILLVSMFVFSSCKDDSVVAIGKDGADGSVGATHKDGSVQGKGEVISEERVVSAFDAVAVEDDIEVYLTQGPTQNLRLEGQENILKEVTTLVSDNKLTIRFSEVGIGKHKPVKVYITIPTLRSVEVSGASQATGQTDWDSGNGNFKVKVSGSGKAEFRLLHVNELGTAVSGAGKVTLSGDCASHDVDISGAGNVYALDMISANADARISGAGNCEIGVTGKLKARVTGSGNVRYRGNAVVEAKISGSGKVQKVD
jgi:hypothetical protein